MIQYTKLETAPLSDRISTLLKDAIIEGHFKPGEEIALTAIAERYGVSADAGRDAGKGGRGKAEDSPPS